jgi:hypothetical protein
MDLVVYLQSKQRKHKRGKDGQGEVEGGEIFFFPNPGNFSSIQAIP